MSARGSGGTPWPIWAAVTILVAVISVFAAKPELLCDQFEIGCSPDQPSSSDGGTIDGIYYMDNISARRVVVTYLSGQSYRIEEPSGSWPWEGTATLSGTVLSGTANFINSSTRMNVEGSVRSDGTIRIEYHFIGENRVDNHVWFPAE
jgi:hypothetical protein